MLAPTCTTNKPVRSARFLQPPWHERHPHLLALDGSLPVDHVARLLRLACQHLDLTALLNSYSGRGSPAYPPALLLPFILFMLFQGYTSPGQWARQAVINDEAKWLLAGLRPARSQLYVLRRRLAPFLDGWFAAVIHWAIRMGVTTARRASIDGTFLACQASRHRLLQQRGLLHRRDWLLARTELDGVLADPAQAAQWRQLLGMLLLSLSEGLLLLGLLLLLFSWATPAWMAQTAAGRRRQLQRHEEASQRLAAAQRQHPKQQARRAKTRRKSADELKVCISDPEAALGLDKEKVFRPLYNVQLAQATDAPLTLAFEVLASCTDQGQLLAMVERTEALTGQHLDEALIDDGYVNIIHLEQCEQRGTVVYAPVPAVADAPTAAPADPAPAVPGQPAPAASRRPKHYAKTAFRWDEGEQTYYCPQGKRLEVSSRTTEARQGGVELPVIQYRCPPEHCRVCPRAGQCTGSPQRGRTVKRYEGEEAVGRLQQRMGQESAQQIYRLRGQSVERGNADLKSHRKLRKVPCFGLARSRTHVGLTLLATNMVAVMRVLRRRQQLPPERPAEAAA
jgi:transposase